MSECYIVLGGPRTGTSLTMGLLTKLGVQGGHQWREGPSNKCYYEHQLVMDYLKSKITAQDLVDGLKTDGKWGMKQPNLLWRWVELEPLILNPHFIITHRLNFQAQVKSHQKAIEKQSGKEIAERTLVYHETVNQQLRDRYPCMDVTFENYFDSSSRECQLQKLAEFCGLKVNKPARNLINPKLRSDRQR